MPALVGFGRLRVRSELGLQFHESPQLLGVVLIGVGILPRHLVGEGEVHLQLRVRVDCAHRQPDPLVDGRVGRLEEHPEVVDGGAREVAQRDGEPGCGQDALAVLDVRSARLVHQLQHWFEEREELLAGIPRQAVHQPEVTVGDLAHVPRPIEDVLLHALASHSHSCLLLPLADVPGDHADDGCNRRGDDHQSPLLGLLSNRGVVVAAVAARAS